MCKHVDLSQPEICEICDSEWGEIIMTKNTNYPLIWFIHPKFIKKNKYLLITSINYILSCLTIDNIVFIFTNLSIQA